MMHLSPLLASLLLMNPAAGQKLEIVSTALHQFDGGPAMPSPAEYRAGETVFFTCLIAGYKPNPKEAISLEYTISAVDEKDVPLVKSESKKIEAELAPEDKEWKPKVYFQFESPNTALCNPCRLKISVKDNVAGTTAAADVPFVIRSKDVEPSESLTVRNFRFLRSEEDGPPLPVAAYRPGDELWARFEITGFKYGPNNKVHVEYGLSVFRPSGAQLYREPAAATSEESSFYPKRFVNGILNLRLQGLSPGEYPIVLEVRDLVGDQKFEARFPFKVE